VAPMVSCRSPEEIQPSPLQVRDEEVGTAHYLRQLETDDGVAPRYQDGGHDGPALAARRTEDDHLAEHVQACQGLFQEVAAHHLQDHVCALAPSDLAHLLGPAFSV